MKYFAFLLLLSLFACMPDQLSNGRAAEQAYVELFYAVHHADAVTASKAAGRLDKELADLRSSWFPPLAEARRENMRYHLDQASWVYAEARQSLAAEDLGLAAIQLDRATYELRAASPAAFRELYIGTIYDFLITWLEVEHTINDSGLCEQDWPQFSKYAKDSRQAWRLVANAYPDKWLYGENPGLDYPAFDAAQLRIAAELENFMATLTNEDQCHAAREAEKVSAAVWEMVLLFGPAEEMEVF